MTVSEEFESPAVFEGTDPNAIEPEIMEEIIDNSQKELQDHVNLVKEFLTNIATLSHDSFNAHPLWKSDDILENFVIKHTGVKSIVCFLNSKVQNVEIFQKYLHLSGEVDSFRIYVTSYGFFSFREYELPTGAIETSQENFHTNLLDAAQFVVDSIPVAKRVEEIWRSAT